MSSSTGRCSEAKQSGYGCMRVESESWRRGGRSDLVDCRVINVEG